jgi:isopentenyl-diphosphate delta-isomerase
MNGNDLAKSLALGADMVGAARPLLWTLRNGGKKALSKLLDDWERELRGIMFLTGARTIEAFRNIPLHQKHA